MKELKPVITVQFRKIGISYILPIISIFVVVSFICGVYNLFHPIGLFTSEYRYGLPSFCFVFGSHGNLNAISLFWLICLNLGFYKTKNRFLIFLIILDLIVMLFTLRSRAFVCIGLYLWFICYYKFKINKAFALFVSIVILVLLGGNTFDIF